MKKLILLAVIFATPTFSQDLTHPLEMGLPDSSYKRPDPAEYQLVIENGLVAFVAEADQVPLVTISTFIRAGKVSDKSQGAAESLQDALKESGQELYDGSMSEAVDRFYEILCKDHPFGSRPTTDDFDGLNADDVSAYYAKYFVPGNLTIAVAGAVDVDDINGRLADLLGDWAAADVPEPKQIPAGEPKRGRAASF